MISKRNKELHHVLKEHNISKNVLSKQLPTTDYCILEIHILHKNKLLQKWLYTPQKKLSALTRGCSLPIFTANKTITNLSQEESDLLKADLNFTKQPDKIGKSEIFSTFVKIHRFLLTTLNLRKPNIR